MARALVDVEGVFLMQPNDFDSDDFVQDGLNRAKRFREALAQAGEPRAILLSSVGAHLARGNGPTAREHVFEAVFSDYKNRHVIRPGYFVENWANVLDAVRGAGTLPTFLPPGRAVAMVSVADIGQWVSKLLSNETAGLTELAGPADCTPQDVGEVFSELLERKIEVSFEPIEAVVPLFTQIGFSSHIAELVKEMYDGYARGTMRFEAEPVRGGITLREGLDALIRRHS